MLRKFSLITPRLLQHPIIMTFSSDHSHHDHKDDVVVTTKQNPHGEKDLRGYENLQTLNENQRSYSPVHSTVSHPLVLYSIFSWFPNSIARLIGKAVAHPKSEIASDSLYLPKITENGIPLYDSINKVSSYTSVNKIVTQISPFAIFALSPQPSLAVLTYVLFGYLYYSTNWVIVKDLVVKAELSPETEELVYQKLTILGGIKTHRAKISDLDNVPFYEIFGESNHSQKSVRGLLNRQVAFRHKLSNEVLLFDKDGIWNQEGINHPLLL